MGAEAGAARPAASVAALNLPTSLAEADAVVQDFDAWLQPIVDAAMAGMCDTLRWQRANRIMCSLTDLDAFVGLLNLAYVDRGQGFMELVDLFKDRALDIPLRAEKLEVLCSGRHRDVPAFCRGNYWLPQVGDTRAALMAAVGDEAYGALEVRLRGNRQLHVYRPSDIPNRHGFSNSHPHDPGCCDKCHEVQARTRS